MVTSRPVCSLPSVCTGCGCAGREQKHLLGLGQAELPRKPSVFDGTKRRCAGAAAVAEMRTVGVRLGHTCGHVPTPALRPA